MPSGRTHLCIELLAFVPSLVGCAALWRNDVLGEGEVVAFGSAYLFSSLFLSPDLDLRGSAAARRWGAARALWSPYAAIFRHRGLSHHILLGPLTRIAYLGGVVTVPFWFVERVLARPLSLRSPRWPLLGTLLVGLYLPNQIHSLVDSLGGRRGPRRRA